MRKILVSILFSCFMMFSVSAMASPVSDVLAQEDPIAVSLVQSMVTGQKDFKAFEKHIDKNRIKDLSVFGKLHENVKEASQIKQIIFLSFAKAGEMDVITYAGVLPNNDLLVFDTMFDANTRLVAGVGVRKLNAVKK